MKKIMDKLKLIYKRNKRLIIFLITIGIIALVFGSIFNVILNKTDKNLVTEYITNFMNNIKDNKLDYVYALKNGGTGTLIYILTVWLLGLSVIGLPLVIMMYFSKIFVIGFSVSSIISTYGFKGCLISFAYIFPHHILNIIIYTLLTLFSLKLSFKIIYVIIKKQKIDFKPIMNKYILVLAISAVICLIALLFECFITPKFINIFLHTIR